MNETLGLTQRARSCNLAALIVKKQSTCDQCVLHDSYMLKRSPHIGRPHRSCINTPPYGNMTSGEYNKTQRSHQTKGSRVRWSYLVTQPTHTKLQCGIDRHVHILRMKQSAMGLYLAVLPPTSTMTVLPSAKSRISRAIAFALGRFTTKLCQQ